MKLDERCDEETTTNTHMKDIFDVLCFTQLVDTGHAFIEGNTTVFTDAVQKRINLKNGVQQIAQLNMFLIQLMV